MEIKCTRFKSAKDKEEMTVIFILDDAGHELKRYTFYNKDEDTKIEPELKRTLAELPNLLKLLYNTGLKKESPMFTEEQIFID